MVPIRQNSREPTGADRFTSASGYRTAMYAMTVKARLLSNQQEKHNAGIDLLQSSIRPRTEGFWA